MRYILPKKSGVHRAACFALYRSLLRYAARLPYERIAPTSVKATGTGEGQVQLPESPTAPVQQQRNKDVSRGGDLVGRTLRRSFRQNVNIQSPRAVVKALEFGYETHAFLSNLAKAENEEMAKAKTVELVEALAQQLRAGRSAELAPALAENEIASPVQLEPAPEAQSPELSSVESPDNDRNRLVNRTELDSSEGPSTSNRSSILDRPLPRSQLTGKRQVPILVHTHYMPFLRIKKPQPEILGHLIRARHKRWQDLILKGNELEWYMRLAEGEDKWDEIISKEKRTERRLMKRAERRAERANADIAENTVLEQHQTSTPLSTIPGTSLPNHNSKLEGGVDADSHPKPKEPEWQTSIHQAQQYVSLAKDNLHIRAAQYAARFWQILQKERALKVEEEGILVPLARKARSGELGQWRKEAVRDWDRKKRKVRFSGEGEERKAEAEAMVWAGSGKCVQQGKERLAQGWRGVGCQ